jgi:pyruvate/2-oxoglutarate dehydrogenase complex dihydrolipoamide dehydrogenase (E3) component
MVQGIDVLIIGSGQAAGPLASALAEAGKQTVLVERDQIGGTCVNVGCTPTKTMIASGRVAYLAGRGADYGVQTGEITVDMETVRQRKRDIVKQWRSGSEKQLLDQDNPRTIFGEAAFTGAHEVTVELRDGGQEEFTAETIVINAGERPAPLDIPGADGVNILNSTTVMELDEVPAHLVMVGGGYVGLEFAQLFRRLGAEVTIVHRGSHLLGREDEDIAGAVQKVLEEDGIEVLLNASASSVAERGNEVVLAADQQGTTREIAGSHLMTAAGRVPNSDSLALEAAGIPTSDTLETNVSGIYAVGDIKPGPKFTHMSYDDYRILKGRLIDGKDTSIAGRMVPYTVFIDPQLGRIGMTEAQARDEGRNIRVAEMPMASVARAKETGEPRGVMKVVVDADDDMILGAAILGMEGGEIASMLQIAMMGKLPYTALRDGIFPHPGLAEAFNNLFASWRED